MNKREEIFKIKIIKEPITFEELKKIAEERYGDMVKAVVDVEREIMALGGDLHSDEEAFLLENGSLQENLWGINLWVEK
jgi:maltose-binding protein MalE